MEENDLRMALLHELKNNLVLLTLTLDNIPHCGNPEHDAPLDEARLLGQKVADRMTQTLLLYKNAHGGLVLNGIDAHSPEDLVQELGRQVRSLTRKLEVVVRVAEGVPAIWFFDRNMLEMALINGVHNSIRYARNRVEIEARVRDGMLAVLVRDDSDGYPGHILEAVAADKPIESQGTGLGLRFARLIARAHRNEGRTGDLYLYNDPGAVFEIRIP